MSGQPGPARLLHVTTVPMSLMFLRGQIEYMRERGLDSQVLSSPGEELGAFGSAERVEVHAVEMPRRITPLRDLRAVWRIYRVMRRVRPLIVHAHTPKGGLLGTLGAWLARVPVRVYQMRGLPLTSASGARRRLLWWTERASCALAHRVVCNSHSLREIALAEGLCSPDRIRVLCGGSGQGVDAAGRFDPDRWPPAERARVRAGLGIPSGAVVLGFVGRLVRDKGLTELAEAWAALREEHPGARLLLVGGFEPQDPVAPGVARALREDPRVHLAGFRPDTPAMYAAMDLVVLPTYREGFPNVLLEAAAMRLPVVATRVAGCVDAVAEGETGSLVPPGDAAALAGALRPYLASPEFRARRGAAGRLRVLREFRQEAIWEAMYREYLALAAASGAPRSWPPQVARGSALDHA